MSGESNPSGTSRVIANADQTIVVADLGNGQGAIPPPPVSATFTRTVPALQVGQLDDRGNTVKYIYATDKDYIIYYSRCARPRES